MSVLCDIIWLKQYNKCWIKYNNPYCKYKGYSTNMKHCWQDVNGHDLHTIFVMKGVTVVVITLPPLISLHWKTLVNIYSKKYAYTQNGRTLALPLTMGKVIMKQILKSFWKIRNIDVETGTVFSIRGWCDDWHVCTCTRYLYQRISSWLSQPILLRKK
jgi:hypothetical protein